VVYLNGGKMILVRAVKPLDDFKVILHFSNGDHKVVDLLPLLRGPIFEPIRHDPAYFRSVRMLMKNPA
jgi:hypothetical protein